MLGENIRALRKARGLSQQELAERLHVVRQTVSKWEQGLSVPDADMLVRLAECLEVSVEELLGAPKPESTAPLEPQAVLADKLSALTGQLAEQNHRRRRFWKWVAIAAGICGLLLLPQLVLTLLMLGYGLPANSSIGIIGGADGPTAIFITAGFPWGLLFAILGCIALVILGIIMGRRPDYGGTYETIFRYYSCQRIAAYRLRQAGHHPPHRG